MMKENRHWLKRLYDRIITTITGTPEHQVAPVAYISIEFYVNSVLFGRYQNAFEPTLDWDSLSRGEVGNILGVHVRIDPQEFTTMWPIAGAIAEKLFPGKGPVKISNRCKGRPTIEVLHQDWLNITITDKRLAFAFEPEPRSEEVLAGYLGTVGGIPIFTEGFFDEDNKTHEYKEAERKTADH